MKILIVEDEPVLALFLSHVLSAYGTCVQAGSGFRALDAFEGALEQGEPFSLVVLDIMMPEASGHDVLQEIRAIELERGTEPEAQVAVMMCSALEDSQNIYHAHSNGCLEYLVKPVGKKDLAKALGRLGFAPISNQKEKDT